MKSRVLLAVLTLALPAVYHAVTPCIGNTSFGIIIPNYLSVNSLAHELGHACGLEDIYPNFDGHTQTVFPYMNEMINRFDLPNDWTGIVNYYPSGITKHEIASRILMLGYEATSEEHVDIPLGRINGIGKDEQNDCFTTNSIGVGLSDFNRAPISYGGNIN